MKKSSTKKHSGKTPSDISLLPEKEVPLKKKPAVYLVWLFVASVAVRFIFAYLFRHGPTVIIDENLYISIAKALALEGRIAYRSQPVNYMYIFYPLLLTPLYLFKLPFDLYRCIQFYNALLISTSVFPAYLLAKSFTGSEKKALISAGFTLLMPDMAMAGYLMSESVIWPLSLWTFYFAFMLCKNESDALKYGILTGVFSALLFWTKPGAVAFGATVLILALLIAIRSHDKAFLRASLAGLFCLAALIGFFYCLYVFVFGYNMSVLGLYNKQLTTVDGRWLAGTSEAAVLQVMLLALSAGGIYAVFPFAYIKEYKPAQKRFITVSTIGIIVSAIGTAALVVMYQWNRSLTNMCLHMRYMAMYVPLLFIFSQPVACRKGGTSKGVLAAFAATALLMIFPGARVGSVAGDSTSIDSMALASFFRSSRISSACGVFVILFSVLFIVFLIMSLSIEFSPSMKKLCKYYFAVFLLVNNICACLSGNVKVDSSYAEDAIAANQMIEAEDGNVLGVTQRYYDDILTYRLEARVRKPIQQITIDNMFVAAVDTKGVYSPFTPIDQSPNISNGETPDVNSLLLGATIAEHLELNPALAVEKTPNGLHTLVHLQDGVRWADTMLYGLDKNTLVDGGEALLRIFDDSRYTDDKLNLSLSAYAEKEGVTLSVSCGGESVDIGLSPEETEYFFTFNRGNISITASGGDAEITTYATSAQ